MKSRLTDSWVARKWSNTNPIKKSILVGALTIVIYLTVVVITTPALGPLDAISAAFQINAIVIFGMGLGIGLQIFLSEKSKLLGCKLNMKKKAFSGTPLFLWVVVVGGCMSYLYFQVLQELECLQY